MTGTIRRRATAAAALLTLAAVGPSAEAMQPTGLTFDRLARPFLGDPGESLTEAQRAELDVLGNRNGIYDIGDLRLVLLYFPELVPTAPGGGR
jgi:hypothetical protein